MNPSVFLKSHADVEMYFRFWGVQFEVLHPARAELSKGELLERMGKVAVRRHKLPSLGAWRETDLAARRQSNGVDMRRPLLWDALGEDLMVDLAVLRERLATAARVIAILERWDLPSYSVVLPDSFPMTDLADIYLFPAHMEWIAVTTHEQDCFLIDCAAHVRLPKHPKERSE